MKYNSAVIEIRNSCELLCNHCCQDYINLTNSYMDMKLFMYIVNKLRESRSLTHLSLTGGEVFHEPNKMYEYISYGYKKGFIIDTITSAIWCKDLSKTLNILKISEEMGLKTLTLSIDKYHLERVPINNYRNLLRAIHSTNIKLNAQFILTQTTDIGEILNPLKDLLEGINISFFNINSIGRAARELDKEEFYYNEVPTPCYCNKGTSLEISFNGEIKPCCSTYAKYIDFKLGKIQDIKNDISVTNKIRKSFLLKYIMNRGFYDLIKKVEEYSELPEKITSNCEICKYIFKNENYQKLILDLRIDQLRGKL
ncbi:MAG: hypothetical protein Q4B23_06720 [Helcococcus sp.]|nr:hypothetical protein [Helcococcus sp.]